MLTNTKLAMESVYLHQLQETIKRVTQVVILTFRQHKKLPVRYERPM